MSKIIILGSGKEADAAKEALDAAGIKFEVVEPTAANLLHIVIGLVDDSDSKAEEKPEDKDEKKDEKEEPKVEEPVEEPAPTEEPAVEESLGVILVDGVKVQAYVTKDKHSTLFAESVKIGSADESTMTSYQLNEMNVGFWPEDLKDLNRKVFVEFNKTQADLRVKIAESTSGASYIAIGTDQLHIFKY
jgi:hypothetical protein